MNSLPPDHQIEPKGQGDIKTQSYISWKKEGLLKIFEEFRALEIDVPKYRC